MGDRGGLACRERRCNDETTGRTIPLSPSSSSSPAAAAAAAARAEQLQHREIQSDGRLNRRQQTDRQTALGRGAERQASTAATAVATNNNNNNNRPITNTSSFSSSPPEITTPLYSTHPPTIPPPHLPACPPIMAAAVAVSIARASLRGGLLRPDPTPVPADEIAAFHTLLNQALTLCSPANIQVATQTLTPLRTGSFLPLFNQD